MSFENCHCETRNHRYSCTREVHLDGIHVWEVGNVCSWCRTECGMDEYMVWPHPLPTGQYTFDVGDSAMPTLLRWKPDVIHRAIAGLGQHRVVLTFDEWQEIRDHLHRELSFTFS